jgi:hypothetical protein
VVQRPSSKTAEKDVPKRSSSSSGTTTRRPSNDAQLLRLKASKSRHHSFRGLESANDLASTSTKTTSTATTTNESVTELIKRIQNNLDATPASPRRMIRHDRRSIAHQRTTAKTTPGGRSEFHRSASSRLTMVATPTRKVLRPSTTNTACGGGSSSNMNAGTTTASPSRKKKSPLSCVSLEDSTEEPPKQQELVPPSSSSKGNSNSSARRGSSNIVVVPQDFSEFENDWDFSGADSDRETTPLPESAAVVPSTTLA